jgi:mannose-6-phosphate isomerase
MIVQLQSNRVWRSYLGGANIDRLTGAGSGENGHYPEDWVASTVEAVNLGREVPLEGLSRTADGRLLRDLILAEPERWLGRRQAERHGPRPSILVKLLDAAERLVIQVHPTIPFAREHFGSPYGKTESWYIIAAEPQAHVYLGFKPGITRDTWIRLFEQQDIPGMLACLHQIPVKPGDMLFVAGGVPHAIGPGCFMVELQEPTDLVLTTERQTPSGLVFPEKKLHAGLGFDRMFDCFTYEGLTESEVLRRYRSQPLTLAPGMVSLLDQRQTAQFGLQILSVSGRLETAWPERYAAAVILQGRGEISAAGEHLSLCAGDQIFIGADSRDLCWTGDLQVVVCLPGADQDEKEKVCRK